jgi:predicted RNA-binding protein with TRAM domain
MNSVELVSRVIAFDRGAAVPTAKSIPWPRARREDALVLAFVRMGGENLPWGFAVGAPGTPPAIVSVPEPRNVDAAAGLMEQLARHLLGHVGHPSTVGDTLRDDEASVMANRQLWLPGATHLSMLQLLEYRFCRTRKGEAARVETLRALARACGWLFRESVREGQFRVMDASARLHDLFAFPTDDVRQQHLGLLLAFLDEPADEATRFEAAEHAEDLAVSTMLDPALERDVLEPAMDRYHAGSPSDRIAAADEIERTLRAELHRRWRLAERAFLTIEADPRPSNPFTDALQKIANDEFAGQFLRIERDIASNADAFVPDPETDRVARAAASRFFAHEESAAVCSSSLVHGDEARLHAAIEEGDGFEGTIVEVRDVGTGRTSTPHWVITTDRSALLALRTGSGVAVFGTPGRTGFVVAVDDRETERRITIEIDGWKRARPDEGLCAANDEAALRGTKVAFVGKAMTGLAARKSREVWKGAGPGHWVTSGRPPPEERLSEIRTVARRDLVAEVDRLRGPLLGTASASRKS